MVIGAGKIVISVGALAFLYAAFLKHDALYNLFSVDALYVIAMASVSIFYLHAAMHWLMDYFSPDYDDEYLSLKDDEYDEF